MTSFEAAPAVASRSAVLFAFDDVSIPATRGLEVRMLQPEKYPANPILTRGAPGEADAGSAQGVSVVREGNRWRLWYSAHDEAGQPRMAYAESRDGLHWEKPRLGLVTFNGTSANNLVAAEAGFEARSVLLDPDAPPERRYALAAMDNRWWRGWRPDVPSMTRIEVSADGLHWAPLSRAPGIVAQQNKVITLYRFAGKYHPFDRRLNR